MRDRRRHRRRRRACRFLPLSNPSLLVALVFLVVVVQIVVQVHVQIHRVLHLETRDVFLPKQQQQRRPTRTIFLQTREKIPRRSQSASSSSSSPSLLQWSNGCQEWINDKTTQRDRNPLEETSSLPTGIVVTLVMIPDEKHYQKGMRTLLCNALASQMMHLLGPQQWDLLLLLTTNTTAAVATTITPFRTIQQCLNLSTHTDEESDEDAPSTRMEQSRWFQPHRNPLPLPRRTRRRQRQKDCDSCLPCHLQTPMAVVHAATKHHHNQQQQRQQQPEIGRD